MSPDTERNRSDGPPTEEIYLELQDLQTEVAESGQDESSQAPVLAEDEQSSVKARIARLRAILTDRGAEPRS
ncbi:MAG: hypothetical protein ABFR95_05100 [Actinomycetota bacterium]